MHERQREFRELYEAFLAHSGPSHMGDVLNPWLTARTRVRTELHAIRQRIDYPNQGLDCEDLRLLCAFLRVVEWLQATLDGGELTDFASCMGLDTITPNTFHQLECEIVEINQSDDDEALRELAGVLWQGIAETSTLFRAYHRPKRPTEDQSHGWGGNSQWRMAIRQDFQHEGNAYSNAFTPLGPRDPRLTDESAEELVRHNCFVRTPPPDHDLSPFSLSLVEPLP